MKYVNGKEKSMKHKHEKTEKEEGTLAWLVLKTLHQEDSPIDYTSEKAQ